MVIVGHAIRFPGEIITCKVDLAILNVVAHHTIYELTARNDLLAAVLPWLKQQKWLRKFEQLR